MRFELAIAAKYLVPRSKQLSQSIISLVSLLVISLVIWLVLVFLSVTNGLEKNWIDKLIALSAPIKLTPKEAYWDSYYHNADTISSSSHFRVKSIEEKLKAPITDPFDPLVDSRWLDSYIAADRDEKGQIKDIVKLTYKHLMEVENTVAEPYEVAFGKLHFGPQSNLKDPLNYQMAYFATLPKTSKNFARTCQKIGGDDAKDLLCNLWSHEDSEQNTELVENFFCFCTPSVLQVEKGLKISPSLITEESKIYALAIMPGPQAILFCQNCKHRDEVKKELENHQMTVKQGVFHHKEETLFFDNEPINTNTPLYLAKNFILFTSPENEHKENMTSLDDITFDVTFKIDQHEFKAALPFSSNLSFKEAKITSIIDKSSTNTPEWIYTDGEKTRLNELSSFGEPIIVAKQFKENGITLGTKAFVTHTALSPSGLKEMEIPLYVAGFFDPGITPIGGKLVMTNSGLVAQLRQGGNFPLLTGFQLWFDDYQRADQIKEALIRKLDEEGLGKYWLVESFKDYEFAKDLVQQLQSDKTLFSLMAIIIIIVACSNIISMLILLVNDKKKEIGILQSMGASPSSIALIFGTCGVILGLLSSLVGTVAAYWTLSNIHLIVNFLSFIQGHEAFNQLFFGDTLPSSMSPEALTMVWIATLCISILAGLIPAIKASSMKPTAILRSE